MAPHRPRPIIAIGINSTGYHGNSWKLGEGDPARYQQFDHYRRVTEIAHAGVIDAVFVSDHPALMEEGATRPLHSLDPITLFAGLAAAVPDIGFILTASTSYNSPYNLARRLATLDLISGGRTGWNAVASFNPKVAANFGSAPIDDHEVRYRRSHEFLDVVLRLWSSFVPPTADIDKDGPALWGKGAIRPIDHAGEFFHVRGPLNVPPSPQGRPVIAQAGGSAQGITFAARYGELIYGSALGRQSAAAWSRTIRAQALGFGRPADSVKIIPGFVPVIGSTQAEAIRRYELLSQETADAAIARVARTLDLDPATVDPDENLAKRDLRPAADRIAPIGGFEALAGLAREENLSLRDLATRVDGGHRLSVGTPDVVAEAILDWWRDGTVDGFVVQPPVLPEDLTVFVDEVLPILRREAGFPDKYTEPTLRRRLALPDADDSIPNTLPEQKKVSLG
jgi:FMN-dependent oxidoreductase (nitrilotriacetate monooxygenase family)